MRHVIRRILFYVCAVWVAVTLDFFITLAVLGANFLADMLYTFLDPRVRIERSA